MSSEVTNFFSTVDDVMDLMAPMAGGQVPDSNSADYAKWLMWIQQKYEEASRRGFWRRLLVKDELSLTAGDTEVYLPLRFQRANSLYILLVDDIDLADPDRVYDGQDIFVGLDTEPTVIVNDAPVTNTNMGRWKITFKEAIATTQTAEIWYFSTPPKPTTSTDKILLPADMVAYGALTEYFRTTNLVGSMDDARIEYENRLATYLGMEAIPGRGELVKFVTNPSGINRSGTAKARYAVRSDRLNRNY